MSWIDWAIIAGYLTAMVAWALRRSRKHAGLHDYYLAGRQTRWWQSGMSTMATQLGAISFVSAPAFVTLKADGGLKWLCYEFGVPLGILLALVVILPILHRRGYISIYQYMEDRFDRSTRTLVSSLFQLGRGLATAVSVLAGGLILSTALPVTTTEAILIIGGVTILYDVLGGIRIVILSDLVQMSIIVVGILLCGGVAWALTGWGQAWTAMDAGRLQILDFSRFGTDSAGTYAFWPMAIGGMFLYASYYGCDQSQVQRELTVPNERSMRRSLLLNAFGRFPVVLAYCVMGVLVGAVFATPELLQRVAGTLGVSLGELQQTLADDPDRMVPMFILTFLPVGLVGLVFVAILSALMSSLDSAINSLSAATMEDFYKPHVRADASESHYLLVSKLFSAGWGIFCVLSALAFAGAGESARQTTIVLINAVGSLLYGPILAAFVLGMLNGRLSPGHVKFGVVCGIVANILLWQFTPVSWLWWNAAGFIATGFAGLLAYSVLGTACVQLLRAGLTHSGASLKAAWRPSYLMAFVYFFVIIGIAYLIEGQV
jgi:SSS family solute:Na+ symporter